MFLSVDDFESWRANARFLLNKKVHPTEVTWDAGTQSELNFCDSGNHGAEITSERHKIQVPRQFITLAKDVACFRNDKKWSLLYSVLWRLVFENKSLLSVTIDPEVRQLHSMQKNVSRAKHKMKAFVRFQEVNSSKPEGESHFVSWFEPEHLIVRSIAPFFQQRFTNMSWSILTPDLCAHWDMQQLKYSDGVHRQIEKADDIQSLWLTYYQNIFNPARLKTKAMLSEMPKKYWRNMPETVLIPKLQTQACKQMMEMIARNNYLDIDSPTKSKRIKQAVAEKNTKKVPL